MSDNTMHMLAGGGCRWGRLMGLQVLLDAVQQLPSKLSSPMLQKLQHTLVCMCVRAGIDIHPMTLEVNFKLPFMREFLLLHGVVDASKTSCLMVLGKGSGQAILLAVGGAQEALLANPGTYDLVRPAALGFCLAVHTGDL